MRTGDTGSRLFLIRTATNPKSTWTSRLSLPGTPRVLRPSAPGWSSPAWWAGWGWRSPPSVSPSWCRRSGQGRELCCANSMLLFQACVSTLCPRHNHPGVQCESRSRSMTWTMLSYSAWSRWCRCGDRGGVDTVWTSQWWYIVRWSIVNCAKFEVWFE